MNEPTSMIAVPFGLLLLVFAVQVFHGIFTTPGAAIGVFFSFVFTLILTAVVGFIGGFMLFGINAYSPALAWLALMVFCAICVFMHDYNKKKETREMEDRRRFHESFAARHKDDLCKYCDASRDGEGSVHHAPSRRNR